MHDDGRRIAAHPFHMAGIVGGLANEMGIAGDGAGHTVCHDGIAGGQRSGGVFRAALFEEGACGGIIAGQAAQAGGAVHRPQDAAVGGEKWRKG